MITAKEIVLTILEEFENKTFVFKPVVNKWDPGFFLALIIDLDYGCGWDGGAKRVIEFKYLKKLGTIEISERTKEQVLPGSNGAYIAGINFYSFDIDLHTSQGLEQLRSYLTKLCSYRNMIIEYEEELNESNLSVVWL